MSFYVSYDSVDVWQHPEVFKLDRNKRMLALGGVPPDYFSKTGQLWNMPVYDWEKLKEDRLFLVDQQDIPKSGMVRPGSV